MRLTGDVGALAIAYEPVGALVDPDAEPVLLEELDGGSDEVARDGPLRDHVHVGSTTSPPLKAASGVRSESGAMSIDIPRGGRPLVTANWIPAA